MQHVDQLGVLLPDLLAQAPDRVVAAGESVLLHQVLPDAPAGEPLGELLLDDVGMRGGTRCR